MELTRFCIPTWAGFLYLALVVDAWSRRIVGWSMATHLRTELVLDALNMALWQRVPEEVVHHSDQSCQLGFKGSSQHLEIEELRWRRVGADWRSAARRGAHAPAVVLTYRFPVCFVPRGSPLAYPQDPFLERKRLPAGIRD